MSTAPGASPRRWLGPALSLAFIAALTLRPAPRPLFQVPMDCLICGDLGGVDVILNVALFVPLGITLVAAGTSWRRAVAIAFATTLLVESLQYTLIPGRDATLSDLLTNTIGGTIGALLATHWRRVLSPPPAAARWLMVAATLLAVGIMSGTAALLRPAVPDMGMWGQWTPQQLTFEPYDGTVHRFEVNDIPIPYNLVPESEPLRQRILGGETRAVVDFTAGTPTRRLSAIARAGSRFQEVLLVGVHGTDLVFRTRLAVRDWLLRLPGIALPDAIPPAGEAVIAMAGLHRNRWYATVHSSRGVQHVEIPFAVSLGWTFILPFDRPLRPGDEWLSALWLAALMLPAAAWGALGGASTATGTPFNRWWLLAVECQAAALLLAPAFAHFAPASLWEWSGLALGAL
ncbi:MAG: VanZ family protein, partial [Gemmatimonadota bacterium]